VGPASLVLDHQTYVQMLAISVVAGNGVLSNDKYPTLDELARVDHATGLIR
jgi:hypothetical protein